MIIVPDYCMLNRREEYGVSIYGGTCMYYDWHMIVQLFTLKWSVLPRLRILLICNSCTQRKPFLFLKPKRLHASSWSKIFIALVLTS